MTANLIPLYGSAVIAITMLGIFARQNRKSGWKRVRPNMAEVLKGFYEDVGMAAKDTPPEMPQMWIPVSQEEAIDFSAQMLKMRSALGTATAVTPNTRVTERELVNQ